MTDRAAPTPAEITAFRKLFEAHYAAIRSYLYFKCGDMQEAEDLAQEAFALAWEKRSNLRYEQAKSYLYTIATNLFINQQKHKKVVLRFQSEKPEKQTAPDPQFGLEYQEYKARLEQAISNLPEKQREVFLMNRIEKYTYTEIAERLELSVKAVEKRMHLALKVLRQLSEKI